jgi:hypothetical protein
VSVRFDADADRLVRTSAPLPAWNGYTFCCFFQMVVDTNFYSALFSLEESGSSYHVLETDIDGTTLYCFSGFEVQLLLGAITVGDWNFAMLTHDGTTLRGYLGPAGASTTPLVAVSAGDANARAFSSMVVGGDGFGEPGNLRLAGVRLWDAVLGPEEAELERVSPQPYRFANIHAWYRMGMADERLVDFSGNGRDLSEVGGGAWESEQGPPVPWRRPRGRLITPAAVTSYVLNAEPGEVNIAGTDAFLLLQARLAADPGAVAITGTPAPLTAAHVLGADPGAVAIAGQGVALQAQLQLTALPGAVSIEGRDAGLVAGLRLAADPGAVIITGTDAEFSISTNRNPTATLELVQQPQAQLLVQPSPAAILELL